MDLWTTPFGSLAVPVPHKGVAHNATGASSAEREDLFSAVNGRDHAGLGPAVGVPEADRSSTHWATGAVPRMPFAADAWTAAQPPSYRPGQKGTFLLCSIRGHFYFALTDKNRPRTDRENAGRSSIPSSRDVRHSACFHICRRASRPRLTHRSRCPIRHRSRIAGCWCWSATHWHPCLPAGRDGAIGLRLPRPDAAEWASNSSVAVRQPQRVVNPSGTNPRTRRGAHECLPTGRSGYRIRRC